MLGIAIQIWRLISPSKKLSWIPGKLSKISQPPFNQMALALLLEVFSYNFHFSLHYRNEFLPRNNEIFSKAPSRLLWQVRTCHWPFHLRKSPHSHLEFNLHAIASFYLPLIALREGSKDPPKTSHLFLPSRKLVSILKKMKFWLALSISFLTLNLFQGQNFTFFY